MKEEKEEEEEKEGKAEREGGSVCASQDPLLPHVFHTSLSWDGVARV